MSDLETTAVLSDDSLLAMQHLSQLQYQLTALRSLLPATVTPLLNSSTNASPEILFTHFASSAVSALTTVKELRAAWEDNETARVLREVRTSLAKSGWEGVEGRWWDSELAMKKDEFQHGLMQDTYRWQTELVHDAIGHDRKELTEHDMVAEVNAFRERQPDCTVDYRISDDSIVVGVSSPVARLNFTVQRTELTPGHTEYRVSTNGTSKLHKSIILCMEARPDKGELSSTLDCLASYKDLGSRKCDKCKRLVGRSALVATARRKPQVRNQTGEKSEWQALHDDCLV